MQLFDLSGHIPKETFDALHQNRLTEDERTELFAHLAICDTCSGNYAESFEGLQQTAPRALTADIRHAVSAKSKHRSLIWYNLKIGFAVFASVLFLFVCTPTDVTRVGKGLTERWDHAYGSEAIETIRESMQMFSEKLLLGGLENEETEK